jgi:hypothetical protein
MHTEAKEKMSLLNSLASIGGLRVRLFTFEIQIMADRLPSTAAALCNRAHNERVMSAELINRPLTRLLDGLLTETFAKLCIFDECQYFLC